MCHKNKQWIINWNVEAFPVLLCVVFSGSVRYHTGDCQGHLNITDVVDVTSSGLADMKRHSWETHGLRHRCRFKVSSHIPCRAPAVPRRANSHIPCRAPAVPRRANWHIPCRVPAVPRRANSHIPCRAHVVALRSRKAAWSEYGLVCVK